MAALYSPQEGASPSIFPVISQDASLCIPSYEVLQALSRLAFGPEPYTRKSPYRNSKMTCISCRSSHRKCTGGTIPCDYCVKRKRPLECLPYVPKQRGKPYPQQQTTPAPYPYKAEHPQRPAPTPAQVEQPVYQPGSFPGSLSKGFLPMLRFSQEPASLVSKQRYQKPKNNSPKSKAAQLPTPTFGGAAATPASSSALANGSTKGEPHFTMVNEIMKNSGMSIHQAREVILTVIEESKRTSTPLQQVLARYSTAPNPSAQEYAALVQQPTPQIEAAVLEATPESIRNNSVDSTSTKRSLPEDFDDPSQEDKRSRTQSFEADNAFDMSDAFGVGRDALNAQTDALAGMGDGLDLEMSGFESFDLEGMDLATLFKETGVDFSDCADMCANNAGVDLSMFQDDAQLQAFLTGISNTDNNNNNNNNNNNDSSVSSDEEALKAFASFMQKQNVSETQAISPAESTTQSQAEAVKVYGALGLNSMTGEAQPISPPESTCQTEQFPDFDFSMDFNFGSTLPEQTLGATFNELEPLAGFVQPSEQPQMPECQPSPSTESASSTKSAPQMSFGSLLLPGASTRPAPLAKPVTTPETSANVTPDEDSSDLDEAELAELFGEDSEAEEEEERELEPSDFADLLGDDNDEVDNTPNCSAPLVTPVREAFDVQETSPASSVTSDGRSAASARLAAKRNAWSGKDQGKIRKKAITKKSVAKKKSTAEKPATETPAAETPAAQKPAAKKRAQKKAVVNDTPAEPKPLSKAAQKRKEREEMEAFERARSANSGLLQRFLATQAAALAARNGAQVIESGSESEDNAQNIPAAASNEPVSTNDAENFWTTSGPAEQTSSAPSTIRGSENASTPVVMKTSITGMADKTNNSGFELRCTGSDGNTGGDCQQVSQSAPIVPAYSASRMVDDGGFQLNYDDEEY